MKLKYFPSSGKYIYFTGAKTKYYVRYNSRGDVHPPITAGLIGVYLNLFGLGYEYNDRS